MARRNILLACAILSIAMIVVFICSGLFSTTLTWLSFQRVKPGMSLAAVEYILGPGENDQGGPGTPEGPAVQGDDVYRWYANGVEMYVGVSNGSVCDRVIWYIDYP
jgi:hypothetical protein